MNRVFLGVLCVLARGSFEGFKDLISRKAAKNAKKKVKISFKLKTLILKYDVSCMVLLCVPLRPW